VSLQLLWHGLFQGAFKHQVLVAGVDDVFYLKRADFQLPIPPLPILEIAPDIIPDLREVYGVAADGTLWVSGKSDSEGMAGERRVRTLASVDFGEAAESSDVVDHELGHPFHGAIALTPHGDMMSVSNLPSFAIYGPDGAIRLDRAGLLAGVGGFDVPAAGLPFWVTGAGDIVCNETGFLVGGFPLNRVDHYAYDGKLLVSLRHFELQGRAYDLGSMSVAKLAFGPGGSLLVSTNKHLFIFSATGEIGSVTVTSSVDMGGGHPDFHLWIAVDAEGRLWTQHYKGKEVAYAAFQMPELHA
jgi:hypothetical protein